MRSKTRRYYSPEFKREAVELASHPGATVAGVARDLGVHANLLRRWRTALTEHGGRAFVRPSGFYAWQARPPSKRTQDNQALKSRIIEIHTDSDWHLRQSACA